jgi:hypothetical protein
VKLLKLGLAILLLPACVALTLTGGHVAQTVVASAMQNGRLLGLAFAAGYGLWLLVFATLPRPTRTYVLGHELTHAIWAWLMGARVGGLRVGKHGGQVRTSKTNWAITLAPYFFPFYAMLFLALFFVAHLIWGLERYFWVLFFLVGLGWSFHVTFTLVMLLTVSQPDVQSQGKVFSAVVIYAMNLVTMLVTTAALAQSVSFVAVGQRLVRDLITAYGWTIGQVRWLWETATR